MTTLNKFGVPLGGGAGRGGMMQPKVKWKFRVRMIGFGPIAGGLELTQQVASVGKPSFSQPANEIHAYNSIDYFAGKGKWDSISLEIRDDVTNAMSKLVGHQIQKQTNFFEQTSPLAGINFKFGMFIEQLDGGNDAVVEQWELEGCFLTKVSYGSLDYSSNDAMMIS